jgi:uncharacterized membrane protein
LETPESWLIESIDAVHDLDNLKLSDSNGADGPDGNSVHATYALRHLLISGQCFEKQAKKGNLLSFSTICFERALYLNGNCF